MHLCIGGRRKQIADDNQPIIQIAGVGERSTARRPLVWTTGEHQACRCRWGAQQRLQVGANVTG